MFCVSRPDWAVSLSIRNSGAGGPPSHHVQRDGRGFSRLIASMHSEYLRSLDTSFLLGCQSKAHTMPQEVVGPQLTPLVSSLDLPSPWSAGLCDAGRRPSLRTNIQETSEYMEP